MALADLFPECPTCGECIMTGYYSRSSLRKCECPDPAEPSRAGTGCRVMDVVEKLRETRALVEKGWTQGASWRNANGNLCMASEAECFCLWGALTWSRYGSAGVKAFYFLGEAIGQNPITFNDAKGRTQAEVIDAIDRAIELAEQSA